MITNAIRSSATFVYSSAVGVAQFLNKNIVNRVSRIFSSTIEKSAHYFESTRSFIYNKLKKPDSHSSLITLIKYIEEDLDKLDNILINFDKESIKSDSDKINYMKDIYINNKKCHEKFLLRCNKNTSSLEKLQKLIQCHKSS